MLRVLPPVLHIQLGLTNYIDDRSPYNEFHPQNIEEDLPDIHEKRMEITTQILNLSNCERELER